MVVSLTTKENTLRQVIFKFSVLLYALPYSHSPFSFVDLNPCAHLSPCENGGTCMIGVLNQYLCVCSPSFTAMSCGEQLDKCNISSYINNATCTVSDCKDYIGARSSE